MKGRLRSHAGIVLVATIYLALALSYGLVTPTFEAPDELWHYLVTRHIADHRSLPIQVKPPGQSLSRSEASQPPLYYLIGASILAGTSQSDRQPIRELDDAAQLNPFGQPGNTQAPENRNIVLHTPGEAFPYSGVPREVHLLRLLSIAAGLVTVVATYALALELASGWREHPKALALGAAVVNATIPQFLFMSSSINNDNLAIALSSLALLAIVRYPKAKAGIKSWAWLGLLAGAAAISKLSGLTLLPVTVVAVLAMTPRDRWRTLLRPMVGLLATVGVIAGWWYLRNLWLYGDVTGLNYMMTWVDRRADAYSWSELGPDLAHLWTSLWALFGWSNVLAENYVYHLFGLLTALSLLGWLLLVARRQRVPAHARYGFVVILGYLCLLSVLLARYHLITYAPEGRLLFPGISGASALLFFGIASLIPPKFIRQLTVAIAVLLIAVAATVPVRSIQPAYAMPTAWATGWPPRVVHEVRARYGDSVELVGFSVEQEQLSPGKVARFALQWRRLAEVDQFYTFFLQVLDKNGQRVGGIDAFPARGMYPVHLWPKGEPVFEVYEIPIADGAAAPGAASVAVGIYDSTAGTPVLARDERGAELGSGPVVGRLKILGRDDSQPRYDISVEKTFGDEIVLAGYSISSNTANPGSVISGSFYWRALRSIPLDYVVFVHLVGPQGTVAQYDSQPDRGGYPTSMWDAGELVADSFTLTLQGSIEEGDYALMVGVYDPATGQRLKTAVDNYVELQRIRVVK